MSGFAPPPTENLGPFHIGRGYHGFMVENGCPCPQKDCGLVDERDVDPECGQHAIKKAKTIRQMHRASQCTICFLSEILDEYLSALPRTDGSDGPYVSWRDPDFDVSQYILTQSTCLLAAASHLRSMGYPVVRHA